MNKEESFEFIIKNYKSMMLNVCRIYSNGEREEMSDLFQEVLLNIWKGIHTFEGKSSLTTWLYRVTLNTAISHLRNKKKQIPIVEIREEFNHLTDKNKPDEQLEILYEAIEKLNEVDKSLIFLYLENKSHKEIAEILGISVSNVGTRIQRIKIKLEHIIKNSNYDKK
ncbi:MAG: sigma-70 family RNA polymerase sigma factor [Bacteroidales bacterium]|jgi:RNA polymerase sigma-70 factor (ECF subfamily)|nr:sigma-70 family RNA polymerase sigma factor [Bacteroidales bacterium]